MPSPHERRRNNVRTGLFVSVTIVAAVAVIVVLSGVWQTLARVTDRYTVLYPVSAGVSNLKDGAEVRVGGVVMGQVETIRPQVGEGQAFTEIAVDFTLDRAIKLNADAQIYVMSPLIGSGAWLEITSVGTTKPPADGVLQGALAIGLLDTILGRESAKRTGEIVDKLTTFSRFLADAPEKYDGEVMAILEDLKVTTEELKSFVERVSHEKEGWASQFMGKLDAAADTAKKLLDESQQLVEENRDDVNTIVENIRQASADMCGLTERLNTETVEKVHALLDHGQEGLDEAIAAIETLREDYEGWSVDVGKALGNASLASQQLKLTTVEVRRSPWKLLYRPTTDELEHELLYEATRSFAVAAADLKAAAESMQRSLDKHGERLRENPELLQRITQNLLDPLQRYELAQQRLFDVLIADGP